MAGIQTIAQEIGQAFLLQKRVFMDAEAFAAFMFDLGLVVPPRQPDSFQRTGASLIRLQDLLREDLDLAKAKELLGIIGDIIGAVKAIRAQPADFLPDVDLSADQLQQLPREIVDRILIDYLQARKTRLAGFLAAFGVLTNTYVEPEGERDAYFHKRIHYDRIPALFSDPKKLIQQFFKWGESTFDFGLVFEQVMYLFARLGITSIFRKQLTVYNHRLKAFEPLEVDQWALRVLLIGEQREGVELAFGFDLDYIPAADHLPGLSIKPFLFGHLEENFILSSSTNVTLAANADLMANIAVNLIPAEPVEITRRGDFANRPVKVEIAFTYGPQGEKTILLGDRDGSRYELEAVYLRIGAAMEVTSLSPAFSVELGLQGGLLVIDPNDFPDDFFLREILSDEPMAIEINPIVGYASEHGLYFKNGSSTGLSLQKETSIQLGPVQLQGLNLSIIPEKKSLSIEILSFIWAELGPFKLLLERIGLVGRLAADDQGNSNLGYLGFAAGFAPPQAVGFTIDAQAVKGGGFLKVDTKKGEYIGFAELAVLDKFNLKALALINTRLPDGQSGYSFLLMISSEFDPVPLGMGFTLEGVGGVIGLHRGLDLDRIQAGVKTGSFDHLLFSPDPLANLPAIITGLNEIMPIEKGHYAFGIMARVAWGTPTVLEIKAGLIFELPNWELALIGVAKAEIKREDKLLARLQVDFAMIFDPQQSLFALDASLSHSKLLNWTLSGDLAMRIRGGNNPFFLLSAGGFHKDYQPPEGLRLPKLDRLRITMADGNPSMFAEVFFAITSNTIQFGALAHAAYAKWGIGFEAELGFAALIQFDPLYFKAEVWGGVYLKFFGTSFGLDLKGTVEGPRPLIFNLYVTFKVWIFSKTVRVPEIRIGEADRNQLEGVPVWPILQEQLEDARNWQAAFPTGMAHHLSLRSTPDGTDGENVRLKFHPTGDIIITQSRVPLQQSLDRFGHHRPDDYRLFELALDGNGQSTQTVEEFFAPAQFFDLSEEDRFNAPAYEKYQSGLRLSGEQAYRAGKMTQKLFAFEEVVFDVDKKTTQREERAEAEDQFEAHQMGNTINQSTLGRRHEYKHLREARGQRYQYRAQEYTVVDSYSGIPVPEANRPLLEMEARNLLNVLIESEPLREGRLEVMPLYEIQWNIETERV